MEEIFDKAKPFLRWAGGKTWLVKHLNDLMPRGGFNAYHEPFLGGGAVFFALNPQKAYLSDLNEELIATYRILKDSPDDVIKCLKMHENSVDHYYKVRSITNGTPAEKAARFIYLNQTSFNGLFRVNLRGEYNVPYGFRTKNFLEVEKLMAVSKRLKTSDLIQGDFSVLLENVQEKDLVFLDPPYTVSHNNNGFIKYNQRLFSIDDQERLSKIIDEIKQRGAYYILSNAAHPKIMEIFMKGDPVLRKSRANLIGGLNARREQTEELIFTNTFQL